MRLDRFLAKSRIIDIKSNRLEGALSELLDVCPLATKGKLSKEKLLKAFLEREKSMTTYLGNGVSLPHLRVPMKQPYVFAVGRCPEGLEYAGMEEYKNLRLIFLLLASDKEKGYLSVLASLARISQNLDQMQYLAEPCNIADFRQRVKKSFSGVVSLHGVQGNKMNRLMLRHAYKVATGADCAAVMVFGDVFSDSALDVGHNFGKLKTILVTQATMEVRPETISFHSVISVRSFSRHRLAQMRSSVLIALSRGLVSFDDKLCCIGGPPNSNQFDTVVVLDIAKEFQTVFSQQADMLPKYVKPEVMERVLAIAMELAVEGREGKAVGCLFVIGDTKKLKSYTKPLVLNPFFGYRDEDRNILNPFMDETVKEFSTIDGAFVIRGDGTLDSAGTLIYAPEFAYELPGGLGSRHVAAAAISKAMDCISITVSSSTRQVTIFRKGEMLPLMY